MKSSDHKTNHKKEPLNTEEEISSSKRELTGVDRSVAIILSIAMVLIQIYLLIITLVSPIVQISVFLMFVVMLTIIYYKPSIKMESNRIPWYEWVLSVVFAIPFLYAALNYNELIQRAIRPTVMDQVLTLIAIVAVLEISRRTIGLILPIIALTFILYTMYGQNLPGILSHRGYEFDRITNTMFMTTNGIFGSPMQVAATMVFMFVIFGAFLNGTGASKVITDAAFALAGKFTGGPAKVAVIASGLMGMVSGSASSNVATTGQVTIPLMKKVGYKPSFAAAVESAASTAGTLTPPIMGAAAFIMAEITGIPYSEIILAGIIPALLFYVLIFMSVHFEAGKLGLKGLPSTALPNFFTVMKKGIVILLPIVLLVVFIMIGYPIMYAAFYSVIALIVIAMFHPKIRLGLKGIYKAIINGAEMVIQPTVACACAGLVIGALNLSGLGLRFSSFTMGIAGESVILALIFTMVITIILGMGLPPVAAYIIAASVTAPALIEIGFPVLASHMFIFYFSALSSITPPVAVTAFIGAGIANAKPLKTSILACFLGLSAYIVPFIFIYREEFLMIGDPFTIIGLVTLVSIGFLSLNSGIIGFLVKPLNIFERLLLSIAGVLILFLNPVVVVIGVALILSTLVYHMMKKNSTAILEN